MMTGRSKERNIILIWLFLLAGFVVRSLVPLLALMLTKDYAVFHSGDTSSYIRPATGLAYSGQFASKGTPEIRRTPGYPVLLIPGIVSGHTELVTIVLQIILSTLTVYLTFRIALLLFGRMEIAVLCAFLYAIEPLSIVYTSVLLTETLFTSVTAVFLYYLLKYLKNRSLNHLLVSSITLSASVYVRPVSYFLPCVITVILLIWVFTKMRRNTMLLLHTSVFFLLSMGLIGLWQIRNKVETGYSGFSAITDVNLYFYQGASVLAVKEGIPYHEMQNQMGYRDVEIYFQNHPDQREWDESKIYEHMRKQGIEVVLGNPLTYSIIHLKGMLRVLLDPGAMAYLKLFGLYPKVGGLLGIIIDRGLAKTVIDLFREKPLVFWSNVLLEAMLALYLLFGIIALLHKNFINNMPMIALLSVGIYFFVLSGGPGSVNRFRHPIMPILCILAGYGLSALIDRLAKKSASHNTGFKTLGTPPG